MENFVVNIQLMVDIVAKKLGVFVNKLKEYSKNMNKSSQSNKKFITSSLSVMFAAQKMSQFFDSLLFPAFQMVGIFDLISTILSVTFLPAALLVLDWVLKLMPAFTDMNPILSTIVNGVVLLGAAIFGLATFLAPIVIVLGQFGALIPVMTFIGAALASIFSSEVIAAILVIVQVIYLVIATFGVLKDAIFSALDLIKNEFQLIWNSIVGIIQGVMKIISGIMTGDWEKIWGGIQDIFVNIITLLIGSLMNFGAGIVNIFVFAANLVIKTLKTLLLDPVLAMLDFIFGMLAKIPGAAGAKFRDMQDQVKGFKGFANSLEFGYIQGSDVAAATASFTNTVKVVIQDNSLSNLRYNVKM